MIGLLSTGSISLGIAFVAGSILVPKPATGMIAFFKSNLFNFHYIINEKSEKLYL